MGLISTGLLFFVILLGLSLMPLKLDLRFRREPNLIRIDSRLYFWLIPLSLNMVNPMTKAVHRMSTNRFWLQDPPEDLRASQVAWRRLLARLTMFNKVFRPLVRLVNNYFLRICRPIKIKKLALYTEIGLEDAAETALAVGLLWGWMGFFYTRIAAMFNTREAENKLAVVPNFQKPGYVRLDYSCIFEFRLGHIIIVIYHTLHNIGEIRKILRRVSQ